MNARFTFLSFILLISAFTFFGCINYEQEVTLHLDGSGSMKIHYWAKENNVMWLSNNKLAFDESKIKEQYKSDNVIIKNVKVDSDQKDSTRHVRVELEFKDITRLSEVSGFKDMKITWEKKGDSKVLMHVLKADTSISGFGMEEYTVTYKYHMPSEVIASNATNPDGKTLIWNFHLPELKNDVTMTATIKEATGFNSTFVIIIVAAIVIIIVVVLYKRRMKPESITS